MASAAQSFPSPPQPVYSAAPVRSQSPQTIQAHRPTERRTPSGNILQLREAPDHSAERGSLDRRKVPQIQSPYEPAYDDPSDQAQLSPILSHFPGRSVSGNFNMPRAVADHSRAVSAASIQLPSPVRPNYNEEQPEVHEPLQYHHLQDQDLAKRASRLTVGPGASNGTNSEMTTQQIRNSYLGADLPRPDSNLSSQSDQRGRTLSPHLSPQRPGSRHSRSPDSRSLSHIDLLNVPYPQAAPSGAENLVNQGLRTAIGENASLLSTRKTLDMYRLNVKKTNDPAIQYEFAIFMISAAQEEGLEEDRDSLSGSSQKSSAKVHVVHVLSPGISLPGSIVALNEFWPLHQF